MNIPGTFEVIDTETGAWCGTHTEYKAAEVHADYLARQDPHGTFEVKRIPLPAPRGEMTPAELWDAAPEMAALGSPLDADAFRASALLQTIAVCGVPLMNPRAPSGSILAPCVLTAGVRGDQAQVSGRHYQDPATASITGMGLSQAAVVLWRLVVEQAEGCMVPGGMLREDQPCRRCPQWSAAHERVADLLASALRPTT